MSGQHTQGRLKPGNPGDWSAEFDDEGSSAYEALVDDRGVVVALVVAHVRSVLRDPDTGHNARRIAACWNACEGISTEALESEANAVIGWVRTASKLLRMKAERDELLAATQGLLAIVSDSRGVAGYHQNGDTAEWDEFEEVDVARAAIANATGGAA